MKFELVLYTRKECCLCDEMKAVIREVAGHTPLTLEEVDVDASREHREAFGGEVPVLFINGRKAFKYRVTRRELEKKLTTRGRAIFGFGLSRRRR